MLSPSIRERTDWVLIIARTSFTSNGAPAPRWIVSVTSLFSGPRILSVISDGVSFCTGWPSNWVMRSPGFSPARAAGVLSMGDTTLMRPFSIETSIPTPANCPLLSALSCRRSPALR